MHHTLPLTPQFYVTAPQTCPYLPNRKERKLFTALQGEHAGRLNDTLNNQGFRRSQNVLYRPCCVDCNACLSVRVRVKDFKASKTQKRIHKKNAPLRREVLSAWATEEQYALFKRYLKKRHAEGGMLDMDIFEFAAMVEETPIRTRVVEYWDDTGEQPKLKAACLTDMLEDGLSMVYSFYDPESSRNSLGTYIILDHVRMTQQANLPYLYLGYWVSGSPRMEYKSRFSALEVYLGNAWKDLEKPVEQKTRTHPLAITPIAEQVAGIVLPDTRKTR